MYLWSQQVLKRIGEDVFRVWSFVLVFFFLLLRRSSKVVPVRPRVPRHTARSTFVCVLELIVRPSTRRIRQSVISVGDGLEFCRRCFSSCVVGGTWRNTIGVNQETLPLVSGFDLIGSR